MFVDECSDFVFWKNDRVQAGFMSPWKDIAYGPRILLQNLLKIEPDNRLTLDEVMHVCLEPACSRKFFK